MNQGGKKKEKISLEKWQFLSIPRLITGLCKIICLLVTRVRCQRPPRSRTRGLNGGRSRSACWRSTLLWPRRPSKPRRRCTWSSSSVWSWLSRKCCSSTSSLRTTAPSRAVRHANVQLWDSKCDLRWPDYLAWSSYIVDVPSGASEGGVQIYRTSKSPFLVHPTLPFIHLHPVYPDSQLSRTKRPGGVHREQSLGDDTRSPFDSLVIQVNFELITVD